MKLTKNEWLRGAGMEIRKNPVVLVLTMLLLMGTAMVQVSRAQGGEHNDSAGNGVSGEQASGLRDPSFELASVYDCQWASCGR